MKKLLVILVLFCVLSTNAVAQAPLPPPVKNTFNKLTSYPELSSYIELLGKQPGLLKVEVIGHSVKGRNLYALKFSSSEFGRDTSKIKILIFACLLYTSPSPRD